MHVRRHLLPGDVGAITALHGRLYAAEHDLDGRFEAHVARGMADAVLRGWPSEGEGAWIAEDDDGAVAGGLGLTDEGDRLGRVRWFLLSPAVRGGGLGRRMLGELVAVARAHGYARLELETFSALEAAAHLYRDAGFVRDTATRTAPWGRQIVMERYVLAL